MKHSAETKALLAQIRRDYVTGEAWLILLGIDKPKAKKRRKVKP